MNGWDIGLGISWNTRELKKLGVFLGGDGGIAKKIDISRRNGQFNY